MGRFRLNGLGLAVVILSIWGIGGCGGGPKSGPPLFPAKVTLTPGTNTSVQMGGTLNFTGVAATASGVTLNVALTFSSSDTSILNIATNGVACAGHWDASFTTCTPGASGAVQVTVTALGVTSIPTYVFVHPAIDNITVTGILLDGVPVQEPCLSQGQSMTVEAHAYSQGLDITPSVGPFTWSANNTAVVTLTPRSDIAYNFPTNQATAVAVTPGLTQIFASASGVSSTTFRQPQYANTSGNSPSLDFFETCPIQSVKLEIGTVGSDQTTFVTSKGSTSAQTVIATLTDVMGNSSLPNTNNGVVLSKVPLTWTASHPSVIAPGSGCTQSCTLSVPLAGAGTVTASCSPPLCNVGFPLVPSSLSTQTQVDACTQFFQAQYINFAGCQQLIPVPTYAATAISGLVTGDTGAANVLATSTGCAHMPPDTCNTATYSVSTTQASSGSEIPLISSPNSLIFVPSGSLVYLGSDFGAALVNPSNFSTSTSPYTSLGTVTGKVLATSNSGALGVFSDTIHTPNQVYIVNDTIASLPQSTPLTISNAVAAAFSPDGLKAFIAGNGGSSLYTYSTLQALQGPIALTGSAKSIAFTANGAFALVAEAAANSNPANLTAFSTCSNQIAATAITLPADPIFMRVLPGVHINGTDSYGFAIPDGTHTMIMDATGIDILTSTSSGGMCPQSLTFVSNDPSRMAQRIELGQGTLQPVNFFSSSDGTQLYILTATSASVLIYDFGAGSVTSGIELAGNATPVSADISPDASTIFVAGSDGLLHEVSTSLGGSDLVQVQFPNLPNNLNPFCTFSSASCVLDLVVAKP